MKIVALKLNNGEYEQIDDICFFTHERFFQMVKAGYVETIIFGEIDDNTRKPVWGEKFYRRDCNAARIHGSD